MKRSIKSRMILLIVPPVFLVLAVSTIISLRMSTAAQIKRAHAETFETARRYAHEFNTQMRADLAIPQTIASAMERCTSLSRQEGLGILHQLLAKNPHIVGTCVAYEPNAFDGHDAQHANTPGHDATGRFIPYWNRLTGTESLDPLVNTDASDWYTVPKQTKSDAVMEPFLYEDVLMTSFVSPILKDGRFLGITTVDVALRSLDQAVSQVKMFRTGYAFLVSNSGVFVSYPNKTYIGTKTLFQLSQEVGNPALAGVGANIRAGKEGFAQTTDPMLKKRVFMFYAPILTGKWGMVVVAPADEMLADANRLGQVMALIGLLATALIGVIVVVVANALSRPIVALSKAADRVAAGDLDIHVPAQQGELGVLARAFNNMGAQLRAIFSKLEQRVAELKRAEDALRLNAERMAALLHLNQMTGASRQEILAFAFEEAIRLTRSKIGYLGYMNEDESAMSVQVWSRQVMPECQVAAASLHFPIDRGGLWAEAVRQRRPLITNNYNAANPWIKGLPDGHINLVRHMNVPVIVGGRIVLVAGVGNKEADYDETDVQQLTLLMEGMWRLIERKRAEEELRKHRDHLEELVGERTTQLVAAKEKAEAASHAKSAFLANMSHELRTPLNAILGYAQILRRGPVSPERQAVGLHTIQESGEHLLTLINDILDLARIEAGKLELQPGGFNLPVFLRVVADIIRVKTEQKNLIFICELAPELPMAVRADEKRLRQVLLNLLGNAVKFTDHGQLTLRVRGEAVNRQETELAPETTPRVSRLAFEVEDTGIGITAEQRTRLFQPFEQLAEARRREGGAGLGLAISRQLVRLMGGEIQVVSEPGKGSRFWFALELPILEAEIVAPAAERVVIGYEGPRKRVLIVDDVPANRLVLADALTALGFEILEAENGAVCLAQAEAVAPDLIVMDVMMPVMDGLEATRRLRQASALKHLPIIAVSASTSAEGRERALAAGVNAFLDKPIELNGLLKVIGELLGLTWICRPVDAKTATEATPGEPLVLPPPEEMHILHEMALRGNMQEIRERAVYLVSLGDACRPFAEKLRRMADQYQSRAILALVKQHLNQEKAS